MKLLRLLGFILLSMIPAAVFTAVKKFYTDIWYFDLSNFLFLQNNLIVLSIYFGVSFFIGFALYFIWRDAIYNGEIKKSYLRFLIPFVLSIIWPFILFILKQLLVVVILLGFTVLAWIFVILRTRRVSKRACKFLIPNFLWILFLGVAYLLILIKIWRLWGEVV